MLKAKLGELVKACGSSGNLFRCRDAHRSLLETEYCRDRFLLNLVVEMYGKCGSAGEAAAVFSSIDLPNVYSWNILLVAFARNGQLEAARRTFDAASSRNVVTWSEMIAAYCSYSKIHEALGLFHRIPERNAIAWTSTMQGCAKSGRLDDCERVFQSIPPCERDVITLTAMFMAYGNSGRIDLARSIFNTIDVEKLDIMAWNAMIHAYVQNGMASEAQELFHAMPRKDCFSWSLIVSGFSQLETDCSVEFYAKMPYRDTVSGNAILTVNAEIGNVLVANEIFVSMPFRDDVTWNSIITAYAKSRKLRQARDLFEKMPYWHLVSWNALMTGCAMEGHLLGARELFDTLPTKDVTAWSNMLQGYAHAGRFDDVLWLFRGMDLEGTSSDEISFLVVLSACAHAGWIGECWRYFTSVEEDRALRHTLEHFGCMVDVLARMGHLDAAEELLGVMPFVPGDVEWTTLLGACRVQGDINIGTRCVIESSGSDPASYILLSNAFCPVSAQSTINRVVNDEDSEVI